MADKLEATKNAWAFYRGSGSDSSRGSGGRVWSKWGTPESDKSKVTLTAAKKDEDSVPVDAWASAKQDRGAKRRASNL